MTSLMRATMFATAAAAALFAQPASAATVAPRQTVSDLDEAAKLVQPVKQRGGVGRHGGRDHGRRGRMGRGRGDSGEWYPNGWPVYGYACPRYQWTAQGWRCAGQFRAYGPPAVVIFGAGPL
jgi:hypothetical protein